MSEEKDESSGMKVVDKRRFNPDGTEKLDAKAPSEASESFADASPPLGGGNEEETSPFQEVSFANLILSLAGSAQMALGLSPNPITQKLEKDFTQAKQSIDLLGVLEEKTKGNLSPEEDSLMKVILSDLRMRYVEEKKKS